MRYAVLLLLLAAFVFSGVASAGHVPDHKQFQPTGHVPDH